MSQSLILIDALSSTSWEKEKKKRNGQELFILPHGQIHLAGSAVQDFCSC
jgi:hypothetical protein